MGRGLRRASWSDGGGCGGAAGLSFGERSGSNGGSAGRWLLPFPGNGPGTGGVFLGRRGRAAAGRRASFSGRGRLGQKFLRGGGCYLAPKTAGCRRRVAWLEGTDRGEAAGVFFGGGERRLGQKFLRGSVCYLAPKTAGCRRRTCWLEGTDRGGAASLFFGERRVRTRFPSPPLFAATARCYRSLLPLSATARRLSLFSACHYPPPATSATVACHPCRCLPSRGLSPSPACHYLIIRCCLHLRRFSPAAPAVSLPAACYLRPLPPLLTASSPPASPLSVAFPRLSLLPAARRCRPPLPPAATARRLPPSSFLLPLPVIIRCCLHPRRFSPAATARRNSCLPPPLLSAICHHPLPAISAAMRRPGGRMGCGGTPRGRSGRDAPPARSSAK